MHRDQNQRANRPVVVVVKAGGGGGGGEGEGDLIQGEIMYLSCYKNFEENNVNFTIDFSSYKDWQFHALPVAAPGGARGANAP